MTQYASAAHQDAVLAERPGRRDDFDALFLEQIARMATTQGQYRKPQSLLHAAFSGYGDPAALDVVLAGHRAAANTWQPPAVLRRYVAHHWLTRWYTNGPDLSYHAEWMLLKMALLRFLLVSGSDLVASIYATDRIVEHHGWIYECKAALRRLRLTSTEQAGALIGF